MPSAAVFSAPQGSPPLVQAFSPDQGALIGYVFRTRDWPPERVGYNAPIEALVGMDLTGTLTGVRVLDYYESHQETLGDFLKNPAKHHAEQNQEQHCGDGHPGQQDLAHQITVNGAEHGLVRRRLCRFPVDLSRLIGRTRPNSLRNRGAF